MILLAQWYYYDISRHGARTSSSNSDEDVSGRDERSPLLEPLTDADFLRSGSPPPVYHPNGNATYGATGGAAGTVRGKGAQTGTLLALGGLAFVNLLGVGSGFGGKDYGMGKVVGLDVRFLFLPMTLCQDSD